MNIARKIKTLLQEAELYHSQGLLDEAMEKYKNATEILRKNDQIKSRQNLIDNIAKKILALKEDIIKIEKAPKKPEVSSKIQDLIKNMFSFSPDKDDDAKALDSAIALAKFGQFKRAILEFNKLLKKDSLRVVAAKSMLRCHMALSSMDEAITQYEQWLSDDIFSTNQLDKLRVFIESILTKEGIEKTLPRRKIPADNIEPEMEMVGIDGIQVEVPETEDHETLDINSIGITIDSGPQEGQVIEFKVRFQLGNVISLLISGSGKESIETFKAGDVLNDIQYYSNVALFKGSGVVASVQEIKVGPRQGELCVDIEVELNGSESIVK